MLEKTESYSKVELLESGHVQLRKTTKITEDGVVLSEGHHRSVVTPLDDITHLPADLQSTITAFWANGHKEAWEAKAEAEAIAKAEAEAKAQAEAEAQAEEVVEEAVEAPAEESTEDATEEVA